MLGGQTLSVSSADLTINGGDMRIDSPSNINVQSAPIHGNPLLPNEVALSVQYNPDAGVWCRESIRLQQAAILLCTRSVSLTLMLRHRAYSSVLQYYWSLILFQSSKITFSNVPA